MYTVETVYEGELVTRATHSRSGVDLVTDAPPDNQGKGSSFSPTDLLAASLGSCMLTIMGILARNHNFNLDGTKAHILKKMASDPRRVIGIDVILDLPSGNYSEQQRRLMEHAARTCPVALSLHPDIRQEITFNYPAI